MKGLLARVRELPKEEEKPYIPPLSVKRRENGFISGYMKLYLLLYLRLVKCHWQEIPLQLRDDLKTPGKKKRNRLDENSLSTNSLVSMNIKSLNVPLAFQS